jgi:glycosyltransferase involved in cell wall biosynthesis
MKILYISCHDVLEYDEVKLLLELGHEVFSTGDLLNENPTKRKKIKDFKIDESLLKQWNEIKIKDQQIFHTKVPRSFIENFDLVIVSHFHEWITLNINSLINTKVIIRTIGQNLPNNEAAIRRIKNFVKIIRYSPMERNIPHYAGEDHLIRFYKDENEFNGWIGNQNNIINFTGSLNHRQSFCNYDILKRIGNDLGIKVFGKDNECIKPFNYGVIPYEDLKKELQTSRVYLHAGTKPASYTLNFMEAFMTGTPIVTVGNELSNFMGLNLYEVSSFIKNGFNGFISDDYNEIKDYCTTLLNDEKLAKEISVNARESAINLFGKETIKNQWKNILGV